MNMNDSAKKEFDEAVKPLHDWLRKYGHPHIIVIVGQYEAVAYEGIMAKPLDAPD